jgi:ribonucleotide reductase alpha subunit
LAIAKTPYESFHGSPLSKGCFHFELCEHYDAQTVLSHRYDWETLRRNIFQFGTRNSLLIAPMPTASTSQILGNTESFEPLTSNLYLRRTLAGEFYVCNPYLQMDLKDMELWNEEWIEKIVFHKGSIENIPEIPSLVKNIYRTVWEIPQKSLIDMAVDRQYFIDQSQSMNIYLYPPSPEKLTKIHFYGWKKGLKTGSYYVRSRAAISSQRFTMDPLREKEIEQECHSCSA